MTNDPWMTMIGADGYWRVYVWANHDSAWNIVGTDRYATNADAVTWAIVKGLDPACQQNRRKQARRFVILGWV